jgi:hypothetical protein
MEGPLGLAIDKLRCGVNFPPPSTTGNVDVPPSLNRNEVEILRGLAVRRVAWHTHREPSHAEVETFGNYAWEHCTICEGRRLRVVLITSNGYLGGPVPGKHHTGRGQDKKGTAESPAAPPSARAGTETLKCLRHRTTHDTRFSSTPQDISTQKKQVNGDGGRQSLNLWRGVHLFRGSRPASSSSR